jgi:hypothetical protein
MSDWGESVKTNLTTGKKPPKIGDTELINGPAWDVCGSGSQYIGKLENLRANSDYSEKYASKPAVLLAVFLTVGIQASQAQRCFDFR